MDRNCRALPASGVQQVSVFAMKVPVSDAAPVTFVSRGMLKQPAELEVNNAAVVPPIPSVAPDLVLAAHAVSIPRVIRAPARILELAPTPRKRVRGTFYVVTGHNAAVAWEQPAASKASLMAPAPRFLP